MLGTAVLVLRAVRLGRASVPRARGARTRRRVHDRVEPAVRAVVGGPGGRDARAPRAGAPGAVAPGRAARRHRHGRIGHRVPGADPAPALRVARPVHVRAAVPGGGDPAVLRGADRRPRGHGTGRPGLLLLFVGVLVTVGGTVWAWRVRTARTVLVATAAAPGDRRRRVRRGRRRRVRDHAVPAADRDGTAARARRVAELTRTAVRRTRVHRPHRGVRAGVAVAMAAVLATGIAVAPGTAHAVATARYPAAACLDRWADGRQVTGVGQFWTVRPLATYTSSNVGCCRSGTPSRRTRGSSTSGPTATPTRASWWSGRTTSGRPRSRTPSGPPRRSPTAPGSTSTTTPAPPGQAILRRDVVGSADVIRRDRGF